MRLFRRNKEASTIQDKAANGIAKGILKSQDFFAVTLFRFTKNWKAKQQWVFLYIICLLFGGLSIIVIIKPFRVAEMPKTFIPKAISIPKIPHPEQKAFMITEEEFQKVQQFKNANAALLKNRPGLNDSLTLIEQAYYSQKK